MIKKINELLNHISNGTIDKEWVKQIGTKYHQQAYIINENITSHEYKPTILIDKNKIIINMHIDQALNHLNGEYCQAIQQFNQLLTKYVNIYNEIQSVHHVNEIEKYIRVIYNFKTQTYNMFFKYNKHLFYTRENRKDLNNPFTLAMRAAIRSDPDVIIVGDFNLEYDENTMFSTLNKIFTMLLTTNNLIYTSDHTKNEIDNIFIVNNGLYKSNELFNAIQSYLNTIETGDYNILDPNFINDSTKLEESITMSQMIDI